MQHRSHLPNVVQPSSSTSIKERYVDLSESTTTRPEAAGLLKPHPDFSFKPITPDSPDKEPRPASLKIFSTPSPPSVYNSSPNLHSLRPIVQPLLKPSPATPQVPPITKFADLSRTEMSIWNRGTLKLVYGNSTFLSLHKLRSDEEVNFFDTLIPKNIQLLQTPVQNMMTQIIEPQLCGQEPAIKSFWNKHFYGDYGDGLILNSVLLRVEKDHFYFERTRFTLSKMQTSDVSGLIEEFQVNEGDVFQVPYVRGRSIKDLAAKILEHVKALKAIHIKKLALQNAQ